MCLMQKKTSQDLLVKYVYHELSPAEKETLQLQIHQDPLLEDRFYEFVDMKRKLEKAELIPSKKSVNKILSFSKAYQVEKTLS